MSLDVGDPMIEHLSSTNRFRALIRRGAPMSLDVGDPMIERRRSTNRFRALIRRRFRATLGRCIPFLAAPLAPPICHPNWDAPDAGDGARRRASKVQ